MQHNQDAQDGGKGRLVGGGQEPHGSRKEHQFQQQPYRARYRDRGVLRVARDTKGAPQDTAASGKLSPSTGRQSPWCSVQPQ
jgi:hypothetical protein